jgi:uncharacterized coiled-coil DUF342 family protein
MLVWYILAGIFWAILWYLIFYLRYEYKDTVNELRSHLKEANNQVQYLQEELDEYTLQNQILKEETTKLLDKNDNLNEVVSELSTYYVHIKKASEKTQELNEYLANPDETIEEKIKKNNKKPDEEKKFF